MEQMRCIVSIGYYDYYDFGEDYNKAVHFLQTANTYQSKNCHVECRIYFQEVDDEEES